MEYKVISIEDKGISNKFDIQKIEQTLNDYSKKGWSVTSVVRSNNASLRGGSNNLIIIFQKNATTAQPSSN